MLNTRQLQLKLEQAFASHRQGQLAQAQALYDEVLAMAPDHVDALHLSGVTAAQTGNHVKAVEMIGKAIAIDPGNACFHCNLGLVLNGLKEFESAATSFDRAISIKPDYHLAHYNRGKALLELDMYNAALASFDKAIAIVPDDHLAHYNRGNALKKLNQLESAVESFDRAITIKPDYHEAWSNRGNALHELNNIDAALASYDKAVTIKPDDHLAQFNRALALHALTRLDEALACYENAIAIRQNFPDACWNKSLALLTAGDFRSGWELYEWRWQVKKLADTRRHITETLWLGKQSIAGKTILLHCEQGLGDTIQFCRYIPMVADLGARVIFEVELPLRKLLGGLRGISELFVTGSSLPESDCHCPLMSLPLAFKTDLDTIPDAGPYLKSDPGKLAYWKERLGRKTNPRVGLVWNGNVTHTNDKNRSIPLSALIRHLPEGFSYVSLQKEVRDIDRQTLESNAHILHFGDELEDFTDTAALCDLMDVVISVDTSVAHLNGALGNPTWVLVPFSPDWRWMLVRDDSPWYRSIRLFRQQKPNDWSGAFGKLGSALLTGYGK
ncbi:MAG: tetratricopeptide repeat protein [Chlorobiaceae bacterium]|nr:tetratricopeptide repeat protein [Chlorobiaceae bacterium]